MLPCEDFLEGGLFLGLSRIMDWGHEAYTSLFSRLLPACIALQVVKACSIRGMPQPLKSACILQMCLRHHISTASPSHWLQACPVQVRMHSIPIQLDGVRRHNY